MTSRPASSSRAAMCGSCPPNVRRKTSDRLRPRASARRLVAFSTTTSSAFVILPCRCLDRLQAPLRIHCARPTHTVIPQSRGPFRVSKTLSPSLGIVRCPCSRYAGVKIEGEGTMGPALVEYLLYEPEESGILWIKFNRPERMNALMGTAEESGTVAKVGEYMRAGDDDPNIRVIVLTGVGRGFCSGANLGSKASEDVVGPDFAGNRGAHDGPDAAREHFFHGFTKLHRDISLIRK